MPPRWSKEFIVWGLALGVVFSAISIKHDVKVDKLDFQKLRVGWSYVMTKYESVAGHGRHHLDKLLPNG